VCGVLTFAAIIALAGCAHAPPAMGVAPPPEAHLIPDRALLIGIADRAQTIRDTSQPTSAKGLAGQLDREHADVDLPAPVLRGKALRPDEIYQNRLHSVLVIATIGPCTDDTCPWPGHPVVRSNATAFALTSDGVCVTNYHVFADPGEDEFMVVSTASGVVYPVDRIIAATKHDDVAVFRIDTRGDRFEPVPLRSDAPIGATVAVISHPERHFFTMTTGAIARRSLHRGDLTGAHSSRRSPPKATPPELPIDVPDSDRLTAALEITAEYALGSSGGPVLDEWGNAVGMVCATDTLYAEPETKQEPQAVVRTCVPAESILRLLVPHR